MWFSARTLARCRRVYATHWRAGVYGDIWSCCLNASAMAGFIHRSGIPLRRLPRSIRTICPACAAGSMRMIFGLSAAWGWIRAKVMARGLGAPMLAQILAERAPERAGNELAAVASVLAKTPSRLVAIALDDILGEREQINIPGTVDEHPNWRRKLSLELEDLEGNAQLLRIAEVFAQFSSNYKGESPENLYDPNGTCQISRP